ncbi:MAG: ornithine carbamoyltransferase [Candidatus Aureabacteria bacterium]|nr:ornithine carbamoyltransferase [Candidatus Auribacterota bacterium]
MKVKDFVSIADLKREEAVEIFTEAEDIKKKLKKGKKVSILEGKTLVMIFDKPSLRTRVTFEVGMFQLGGIALDLDPSAIQLGVRETVYDAAMNFSRWVNGIMIRTFSHDTVRDIACHCTVPVINGLTDLLHPCQIMADIFTIMEKFSINVGNPDFKGLKISYIGDGNNVANSLINAAGLLGFDLSIGSPEGYTCNKAVLENALECSGKSGAKIELFTDPAAAIRNADVVYTDVWASMGKEDEREKRIKVFSPYQVNKELLSKAKKTAYFMHCLPAHRGEEVTDEVIDSEHSIVFDQAENRLHVQKGILSLLLRNK